MEKLDQHITIPRDTIYAFATAPGKAGVAILRISGSGALRVLELLGVSTPPAPRQAALVTLRHPETADVIDRALCLYFAAPNSFTGEEVLELHLHGSLAIKNALLDILSAATEYRLAEPGEFTRRAFINDKMDLTESEGLVDLIEAQTSSQLNQAMRQMSGVHKAHFESLRGNIIQGLALLEAYIDFPDEDIPESLIEKITNLINEIKNALAALLENSDIGERVRNGFEIVLIGAPNAGKSSLLNALSGRDVAIVHETPGTTRDMVEMQLDLGGYAVTLVDTAGLRDADNAVEEEGIRRAKARAHQADLTIELLDITDPEQTSFNKEKLTENTLTVFTKRDLCSASKMLGETLSISTKTGDGMEAFLRTLKGLVEERMHSHTPAMITRARHREHLQLAKEALDRFDLWQPLELACEELRHAATQIGNITGKIATDDLLDVIFKELCIGK